MKQKYLSGLILMMLLFNQPSHALQNQVSPEAQSASQYHGDVALDQLSEGNVAGAMKNLKKAIDLNPFSIRWRVEYTRLLQAQAQGAFKAGKLAFGRTMFKAAEKEMVITANLLVQQGQNKEAAKLYYNVAQLNEQVFQKRRTAYAYYQKASQLDPQNLQVVAAIKSMTKS